jgi:hypothetical protein
MRPRGRETVEILGFTDRTWERYHAPMAVPEARVGMGLGGLAHGRVPGSGGSAGPPADHS